jgi:NB-ARC domain
LSCPKCGSNSETDSTTFCSECEAATITVPKPTAQIEVTQEVGTVEGGQLVGVDLGEVLGDVSIGNYTLRIGTLNGGVVNIAPPQPQQQLPQARPAPVRLIPRKSPGLLDRKQETSVATSTLLSASPAEFHGPPGIGKTKLLRHLAYQQFDSACPDGVVYLAAVRHKPVEDVLLDLFDAFYEREATYKPTAVQVQHSLQDKQALIILDDVDLERDEVTALMDAAPGCTFLLASTQCCLWGEGRALALQGLPLEDALSLIERELGRSLSAGERPGAEALCTALQGHPLSLQQVATLVREDDRSLADLSSQLRQQEKGGPPAKALTEQALAACSEQEKQILAVLAITGGASLGRDHVRALTGIEDIDIPIESLKRRKLAQSHSPRYSLTGSLGRTLEEEEWDLTSWNEQALEYFAAWAEQHRQNPRLVIEEIDAIVGILSWALQEGRWEGALRLGRAVEGALAVSGQWGAWAQVLSWQLQAARELGDRAAQAWALHQSGTRGLCLDIPSTAQTDLSEALQIRESLGDWAGAAVTRHNLEVFGGPGGTSGPQGNGNGSGGGGGWLPRLPLWQWLIAVVTALVVLGLGSSMIVGRSLPLGSNNSLEAATQWVAEPVAQLLQPALQVLQPATQAASNSDTLPSTPSSEPDSKSGDSSNPGSDSGASSTESSDDSGSGSSDTEPGDDGGGSDDSTESSDGGSDSGSSGIESSDGGSGSGDRTTEPDEEGIASDDSNTELDAEGSAPDDSNTEYPSPLSTESGDGGSGSGSPFTDTYDPSTLSTEAEFPITLSTEPTTPESTPPSPPDPEGTIDYGGSSSPEGPGSDGPILR